MSLNWEVPVGESRFAVIVLAVAVVLGLAFGFAQIGKSSEVSQASTDRAPEERSATQQDASDGPFELSLGFAGDLCLADNYIPLQHLKELGSTDITDGIDRRFVDKMNEVDLMWINNEFVFSDRGEALEGKMWTFRGATKNVSYLHDLGADIVGLANNHVFDYGEDSFLDTLDTLSNAGIVTVGAGRNFAEASAPVYLESHGVKIAYVAASCAEYEVFTPEATETTPGIMWCYDDDKFLEEIREAAAHADYVIALPHWGTEHSTVLEEKQISSAHAYIDAGADAVIGTHPHILQGIEFYNGKPIMYSLGNFWFDDYDIDTLVAELRITGEQEGGKATMNAENVELVLYPGTQSNVFTSWASTPDERNRIFRYLEEISDDQVRISDDGVVRAA